MSNGNVSPTGEMESFGREAAGTEVEMSLLPSFQLWNFSSTRPLVERLPVRKWRSQAIFRNCFFYWRALVAGKEVEMSTEFRLQGTQEGRG